VTISHDLLRLKLAESLAADPPALARRDVVLPGIPGTGRCAQRAQ
jgi:hypothetical protein